MEVAVVGAYHTALRKGVSSQSLEEMIFEAARETLVDAALHIGDMDAIVIATADQEHGRVIESMVTAGAAGAVGRDFTTVASAGEHAFVYAYLRILAGQAKRVLALTWGKPSEALDPNHAELVAAEPFLLRPLGMNSTIAAALQASAYVARFGIDESAIGNLRTSRVAAATRAYGALPDRGGGVVAWPLARADLPEPCDGAFGLVLVSEDSVEGQAAAWIHGVGWATDSYDLGTRDLTRFAALAASTRMALNNRATLDEVEVVEVQEVSTIGSFAACEAIGLAPPGRGSVVALGTRPVVNPSGGNIPMSPGNAAGFMRISEAAQQVRGQAGPAQVVPHPRKTLAATLHGFAGQGAVTVTFGSSPRSAD